MNTTLMEELLNEEESATLDFKRDQYQFAGASDDDKSEIIKDILIFANAWRRTDAYILLGVEEVKGGRSNVIGVTHHIDDASLQQLVNSKTQRPVVFSYEAFPFEGKQIGVIRIPVQDRPLYLKKDFGKLKKEVVYIRRSSSTDIAGLDEIAKMGTPVTLDQQRPILELQFANVDERKLLGRDITVVSTIVNYDESKIPLVKPEPFSPSALLSRGNRNYYRDKADYIAETSLLNKLGFYVRNGGSVLASNVRLIIQGKATNDVTVCDQSDYPEYPQRDNIYVGVNSTLRYAFDRLNVEIHGNDWTMTALFGSIQPKAIEWSSGSFYVGAERPTKLDLTASIYADNIAEPIIIPISITIEVRERNLVLEELKKDE